MVLLPDVVTVGLPVVNPEYFVVGIDRITTPDPPCPPLLVVPDPPPPPPPPPVLRLALDAVPVPSIAPSVAPPF